MMATPSGVNVMPWSAPSACSTSRWAMAASRWWIACVVSPSALPKVAEDSSPAQEADSDSARSHDSRLSWGGQPHDPRLSVTEEAAEPTLVKSGAAPPVEQRETHRTSHYDMGAILATPPRASLYERLRDEMAGEQAALMAERARLAERALQRAPDPRSEQRSGRHCPL